MRKTVLAACLLFAACAREEQRGSSLPPDSPAPPATQTSAPATSTKAPDDVAQCSPAPDRLCPVDEASADPSFVAFRERLQAVVAARDAAALERLVDPNIRTSFGANGGLADLRKQWNYASSDSALWPLLARILSMGGKFVGEGDQRPFFAPYIYAAWPDGRDAFTSVVAVRSGVILREEPSATAAEVARVDWAILETIPEPNAPEGWHHVVASETRAWVPAADVWSPIGYRAGFQRVGGEWKMNVLVAGD